LLLLAGGGLHAENWPMYGRNLHHSFSNPSGKIGIPSARKAAETKRRQAEARAEAAEEKASEMLEKEKQSAGWVACQYPEVYRRFGKTVNGVLYHPANIICP
jgi:hypothetical protein